MTPRRKKSSSFWKITGWILFGLTLVAGIVWFTLNSSFLKINKFEVSRSPYYSQNEVFKEIKEYKIGQNPLLATLGPRNILFWALSSSDKTPPELSAASSVKVDVSLFKRKVSAAIESRDVFGVACNISKDCYTFNEKGTVLTRAPYVEGNLVLRVEFTNKDKKFVLGKKILPREEWNKNLIETLKQVKESKFEIENVKIKDLKLREWVLSLPSVDLYFDLNFVPEQLPNVLKRLRNKTDFSEIEYVDFRVRDRVYYK